MVREGGGGKSKERRGDSKEDSKIRKRNRSPWPRPVSSSTEASSSDRWPKPVSLKRL